MTDLSAPVQRPGAPPADLSRLDPGGPERTKAPRSRGPGIALRAVVILAIAGVLWWLGRPLAAAILVTLGAIVTIASALSQRFADGVETVVMTVTHWVGRVLTFLLLGLLEIVVILPVWLLSKLFRKDPLSLGWSPRDPSIWRPGSEERATKFARRQFTDERAVRGQKHERYGRLPFPRTRAVVGLVVVLVLLDLAVGAGVDAIQRARTTETEQALVLPLPDSPSRTGEPWATKLNAELSEQLLDIRYDPFLGWRLPDYHGTFLNMTDGVRRSYEPATTPGAKPIKIYFFGGSAMWGMYQRDERTIPSEVARLAEADGIPVQVVNYGAGAYVNWQEVQLFEQLVSGGARPDLAVFYDGVNDLMSQFREGPYTEPTHLEASAVKKALADGKAAEAGKNTESLASRVTDSWSNTSAVNRLVRAARRLLSSGSATPPPDLSGFSFGNQGGHAEQAGTDGAAVVGKGVDVAQRLGASYGFRTAFFWQPSLYSKQPGPGDAEAKGRWGEDGAAWKVATDRARANLPSSVVDLGSALDVPDAVMYDYVHTNERGARAVAAAMYANLKPALQQLVQERAG